MIAFLVLLYGVFMGAMLVCGVGLYTGIFDGGARSFSITVIPAIFAAIAIVGVRRCRALRAGRPDADRAALVLSPRLRRAGPSAWRRARRRSRAACARRIDDPALRRPRASSARSPGGASTSRACGRASTPSASRPAGPSLIAGYFIGQLANTLPVPGGIGGGGRRHDRRVRRLRDRLRPRGGVGAGLPRRSRSGCRRSRARSPTFSCGAGCAAGRPRPSRSP